MNTSAKGLVPANREALDVRPGQVAGSARSHAGAGGSEAGLTGIIGVSP